MTTQADHTVQQDVYRPTTKAGAAYLKLTVVDDVLIVSFSDIALHHLSLEDHCCCVCSSSPMVLFPITAA